MSNSHRLTKGRSFILNHCHTLRTAVLHFLSFNDNALLEDPMWCIAIWITCCSMSVLKITETLQYIQYRFVFLFCLCRTHTGFYLLSISIDAGSNNSINPICCLFKYLWLDFSVSGVLMAYEMPGLIPGIRWPQIFFLPHKAFLQ